VGLGTGEHRAVPFGLVEGRVGVRAHALERPELAAVGPGQDDQLRVGDDEAHAALVDGLGLAHALEHWALLDVGWVGREAA
jgi:hypothetical protein